MGTVNGRPTHTQMFQACFSKPGFASEYKLGRDLGKGAFSTVYLAHHVKTKAPVAVKVVLRKKLTRDDERALQAEVQVLEEVRGHEGIITLIKYFAETQKHYLVLEVMSGGELFQRIVKREKYSEGDALVVVTTIARVLEFIHGRDICHRDLKPENILLKDRTESSLVKIADFGFSRHVGKSGCRTACGTPAYVAPEVISGKVYATECDVWSLGVIMFVLLCGYPPFYAKSRQDLFRLVRAGNVVFDDAYWSKISPEAKDLIRKMLVVDVRDRYTAKQVLAHPWVTSASSVAEIDSKALKLFNAKRKLRAAFKAVVAAGRIHDLVKQVKKH